MRFTGNLKSLTIPNLFEVRELNTRILLFVILSMVTIVVVAGLVVLYENAQSPTWSSSLEHFATDFTVDGNKVFVADGWGNVYCFDTESGRSLWNATVGAYTAAGSVITTYEGKVYVGSRGSVVNKLDEDTGKVELSFQATVYTSYGQKSPPEFFVADGKVFVSELFMTVYDAHSGELFWNSTYSGITLGNARYSASESSYIFVRRTSRINANNGQALWSVIGDASDPAVVSEGKVILWNYNPTGRSEDGQSILCVDAFSGAKLWEYDVGVRIFQPTVSNSLVLFGAEDGCLYAVNFADGSLEWKTFVDDQRLIETFNGSTEEQKSLATMRGSLVQVDSQSQRVFWSVVVSNNGQDIYVGAIWSLDLSNGDRIWTSSVSNNNPTYTEYGVFTSISLSNGILYATEHSDLYFIDAYAGNVRLRRNFDHYVLPPVVADDKVFVAEDLRFTAYK